MRVGLVAGLLVGCSVSIAGCAAAKPAKITAAASATADYKREAGPHKVAILLEEWNDPGRNRTLPVKVYLPTNTKGPLPIVLFSHGLGGSREGGAYLGEHLASHGYVAVHMQHPGTDESVWRGTGGNPRESLMNSLRNPSAIIGRFTDPSFVVDYLVGANRTHPKLKGLLDTDRIGMSGHSFGARTTMAIAGEKVGRSDVRLTRPEYKAAIVYSPSPPRDRSALSDVKLPIFHFTGTDDASPMREMGNAGGAHAGAAGEAFGAEERTLPFQLISGADQYLYVIKDADHAVFSGRRPGGSEPTDARDHMLVRMASVAFWDAYLKDDPRAKAWLRDADGAKAALAPFGRYEVKSK